MFTEPEARATCAFGAVNCRVPRRTRTCSSLEGSSVPDGPSDRGSTIAAMADFPKIISVDDHVIEPANVWQDRLPPKYHDVGPRVVQPPVQGDLLRRRQVLATSRASRATVATVDWWLYEDMHVPQTRLDAAVGFDRDEVKITRHHLRRDAPGLLGAEGPPRGHGRQLDRGVAVLPDASRASAARRSSRPRTRSSPLLCVKAYNDWMVDEWCGDSDGRLIPLIIIPLWDAELAAARDPPQRRARACAPCASARSRRTSACRRSTRDVLGPVLRGLRRDRRRSSACTSARRRRCRRPRPMRRRAVGSTLTFGNAMSSMVDWLMSRRARAASRT